MPGWADKSQQNHKTAWAMCRGVTCTAPLPDPGLTTSGGGAPRLQDPCSAANRAYYAAYTLTRCAAEDVKKLAQKELERVAVTRSPSGDPNAYPHSLMRDPDVLRLLGFDGAFYELMKTLWRLRKQADYSATPLASHDLYPHLQEMDKVLPKQRKLLGVS